jgi:hypothetical protein
MPQQQQPPQYGYQQQQYQQQGPYGQPNPMMYMAPYQQQMQGYPGPLSDYQPCWL